MLIKALEYPLVHCEPTLHMVRYNFVLIYFAEKVLVPDIPLLTVDGQNFVSYYP
jgi:hypothetical protein